MTEPLAQAQIDQLEKKMARFLPEDSLAKWLTSPGLVVKRAELWMVLLRFWQIKEMEAYYNRLDQRFYRFMRELVPWMEDPAPSPFERGFLDVGSDEET